MRPEHEEEVNICKEHKAFCMCSFIYSCVLYAWMYSYEDILDILMNVSQCNMESTNVTEITGLKQQMSFSDTMEVRSRLWKGHKTLQKTVYNPTLELKLTAMGQPLTPITLNELVSGLFYVEIPCISGFWKRHLHSKTGLENRQRQK